MIIVNFMCSARLHYSLVNLFNAAIKIVLTVFLKFVKFIGFVCRCITKIMKKIKHYTSKHLRSNLLLTYATKCGCHILNDDDVAADLPLQLTLCPDWRSRSGCAPSYDPPRNRDVVCCRTSDGWQHCPVCPWQPLCQGHARELWLEGSLDVALWRCSSSGTYVIWSNILAHGSLITYEQDVTASLRCTSFTIDDSWLPCTVNIHVTYSK